MRLPAYLTTLFIASVLTACGGGGGDVSGSSDTEGDTGSVDTGELTTSASIDTPSIGTGTGDSYQEGVLNISSTSLSAGGSTQITATIVDAGNSNKKIVSEEYTIVFNSSCSSDGRAEFSKEEVTTSSGEITVTYTAKGCSGEDFLTFGLYPSGLAVSGNRLAVASGLLTVAPAEVGSLGFVEASSSAVSIKTIGNNVLPKTSVLTFRVSDTSGNPVANKEVGFALTNTAGGISLALDSSVTNENGEVNAVVLAGTVHAVTYVIATTFATDGVTSISTSSLPVSVTTGLPDQDSFDIAVDTFNPASYDYNGELVNVVVYASDHFNNPVPDGTVINFAAESGAIGAYCETAQGSCSVEWKSSGDRPGSHPGGLGKVNDLDPQLGTSVPGMTSIVAYTLGESGYTDQNGNGVYDVGEPFVSYPEAFRDDDADGTRDATEEFFDFDGDGSYDATPPAVYQGTLCSADALAAGHCAQYVHVRDMIRIVQSSHYDVNMSFYEETAPGSDVYVENTPTLDPSGGYFYVLLQDANGNIPGNGTKISVAGDGYRIYSMSGDMPTSTGEIENAAARGLPSYGYFFRVTYVPDGAPLSITVSTELNNYSNAFTLFN